MATISFSRERFLQSVLKHKQFKKEWEAKMEKKLSQMEEEVRRAKADSFFKVEAL